MIGETIMCNCIANIDKKLKDGGQCLDATLFGNRRAGVSLIRTDKWVAENRRNKPRHIIANYCPFCGVEYPENADKRPAQRAAE